MADGLKRDNVVQLPVSIERGTERYRREWDPRVTESNDSLSLIFSAIPEGAAVLDVGCSVGQLGGALKKFKGCDVIGIEIDPVVAKEAESRIGEVLCGDIESISLSEIFGEKRFDAIVFADVLEHLTRPVDVLLSAQRFLTAKGAIYISLPNIAHAAVRIALFEGRFEYSKEGLLDETHTKFYTRRSFDELLRAARLAPVDMQRTYLGARDTEINISTGGIVTEDLIRSAELEPEGMTYQFVATVVPVASSEHAALIQAYINNLEKKVTSPLPHEPCVSPSRPVQRRILSTVDGLSELYTLIHAEAEKDSQFTDKALSEIREEISQHAKALHYIAQQSAGRFSRIDHTLSELRYKVSWALERVERYADFLPFRMFRALRRRFRKLPPPPKV